MADHDNRWRDDRGFRRPSGERDSYRGHNYSEDDYGAGYGEEGLTNYRLRNASGPAGYGQRSPGYGNRGDGYSDRPGNWSGDWQRDLRGDFSSNYESGSRYGRGDRGRDPAEARRNWNEDRSDRGERGFWDRASDEVASWFGDEQAEQRRHLDARHEGRGPKGYRRSDDRIREDVSDRLTDDPFVDASDIEIQVSNAEVTLTGTVDSRNARRRAEDLVERCSGVSHVQNNLRVTSASETVREERDEKSKGVFSRS
jgi:osmotically-inducible protein OsmY